MTTTATTILPPPPSPTPIPTPPTPQRRKKQEVSTLEDTNFAGRVQSGLHVVLKYLLIIKNNAHSVLCVGLEKGWLGIDEV